MLKLDFLNNDYSLEEVKDAYTDGNLDSFKGDEDFLNFLISYSLGKYLDDPNANAFKQSAQYGGLLNIMRLDEYGYLGKKIYKIYEICGKDKMKFIRVCDLIGQYGIKHSLEKTTIDTNLRLKKPVDFIDDTIVLSSGIKPKYNPEVTFILRYGLEIEDELEYDYELERSLRRRINESIKTNNDDIELLEELPSYVEKKRLEKIEAEAKRVKDDYEIRVDNIYFGKQVFNMSSGLLSMEMNSISWFEDTNVGILNYKVFRSVPEGDYCLIDSKGNIHIPDERVSKGGINIGPNSPVRKVEIASIPKLFELSIQKLEDDPIKNEEAILRLKSLNELLESKQTLTVAELKQYESIVRDLYEELFGLLFSNDDDKNYEIDSDSSKKF